MLKLNIAVGILAFAVYPLPIQASILIRVVDGDSVIARIKGKQTNIRLACIDAPEIGQAPYGRMAMNTLGGLLPRYSQITIQPIEFDRYNRLVANIFTPGGINLGEELIRMGLVFVNKMNLSYCDGPKLLLIESQARQARIGVWKDRPQGIMRPWLFRRGAKLLSCNQVNSWEEAQELLRDGHTYLDLDDSGEACKSRSAIH